MTHRIVRLRPPAALLGAILVLSACGVISTTAPAATPADFQGIAGEFARRGIVLDALVSGDAGCTDHTLMQTAIGFDASGLDQDEVVRVHLYIFRNRDSYDRLRTSVDECVAAFVTDPATFESMDDSPFVMAGQGPWAPRFKAALREGLDEAAGTGD